MNVTQSSLTLSVGTYSSILTLSLLVYFSCPGVIYIGPLSLADTHRTIADSFALVNSSVSEGMSTAILEVNNGVIVYENIC